MPVAVLLIQGRSVLLKYQTSDTPFKLGRYGCMCNNVAVLFVGVTTVFFCFPTAVYVDTDTMNYVSAVIGIFLVLLVVYWAVYGKRFEGRYVFSSSRVVLWGSETC
jgi:choline transport protein